MNNSHPKCEKMKIILAFLQISHVLAAYEEALSSGIIFHKESKILLAEKFVHVQFLVPFPKYNFTLKSEISQLLDKLSEQWRTPSIECPLDFSTNFNTTTDPFNLNWLVELIENKVQSAQQEVDQIKTETARFLNKNTEEQKRTPRGAPIIAAAAIAGIGLFGSGIMMGNSDSCGIMGIFGSCQDQARANAENIEALEEYSMALTDYVAEVETSSNEKFFAISNELAEIKNIQKQTIENQNKNWKVVQEQFETIQGNFHILRDCTQTLFSNQQLNFNYDTASSLLAVLHADITTYKAALYAFKSNILNSIPTLLDKRLPMSLVPRESLLAVIDAVYRSQKDEDHRLSLAIPPSDVHSYYDAKLLRDVLTVEEGILLSLAIPYASSQTAFQIYRAHVVPMPQSDPTEAIRWVTEGPYLAISEDSMETTVLTKEQYVNCLGTSTYRICHQTMETHLGQSTCLATLYFHSTLTALTVCETEKILLPTPEKATNLGFGIWLITSASAAFFLREYSLDELNTPKREEHAGCQICLITLDCGTQLISKYIKIRPDLDSCDKIPAKRIDVKLPAPLHHLLSELPEISDLPYFESKTEAGIKLLREVKAKLIDSPHLTKVDQLNAIAKPIAHNMRLLKPSLVDKMEQYVPLKMSLTLTLTVFIGNLLLHALAIYLYHRFAIFRRLTPKFLKGQDGNIALRPVLSVAATDRHEFQKQGSKLREKYMVLTQTELNDYQTPVNRSRLTSACSSMGNISKKQESQVDVNEIREESLSQI